MKCRNLHCKNEGSFQHANGLYFCEECMINLYRANDLNLALIEKQEEMAKDGIKHGSIKWIQGTLGVVKKLTRNNFTINWADEFNQTGLLGVLKVFIVRYFLLE